MLKTNTFQGELDLGSQQVQSALKLAGFFEKKRSQKVGESSGWGIKYNKRYFSFLADGQILAYYTAQPNERSVVQGFLFPGTIEVFEDAPKGSKTKFQIYVGNTFSTLSFKNVEEKNKWFEALKLLQKVQIKDRIISNKDLEVLMSEKKKIFFKVSKCPKVLAYRVQIESERRFMQDFSVMTETQKRGLDRFIMGCPSLESEPKGTFTAGWFSINQKDKNKQPVLFMKDKALGFLKHRCLYKVASSQIEIHETISPLKFKRKEDKIITLAEFNKDFHTVQLGDIEQNNCEIRFLKNTQVVMHLYAKSATEALCFFDSLGGSFDKFESCRFITNQSLDCDDFLNQKGPELADSSTVFLLQSDDFGLNNKSRAESFTFSNQTENIIGYQTFEAYSGPKDEALEKLIEQGRQEFFNCGDSMNNKLSQQGNVEYCEKCQQNEQRIFNCSSCKFSPMQTIPESQQEFKRKKPKKGPLEDSLAEEEFGKDINEYLFDSQQQKDLQGNKDYEFSVEKQVANKVFLFKEHKDQLSCNIHVSQDLSLNESGNSNRLTIKEQLAPKQKGISLEELKAQLMSWQQGIKWYHSVVRQLEDNSLYLVEPFKDHAKKIIINDMKNYWNLSYDQLNLDCLVKLSNFFNKIIDEIALFDQSDEDILVSIQSSLCLTIEIMFLNNYIKVLLNILKNLWSRENISFQEHRMISLAAPDVILFINDFFNRLDNLRDDSSFYRIYSSFLDTISMVITENCAYFFDHKLQIDQLLLLYSFLKSVQIKLMELRSVRQKSKGNSSNNYQQLNQQQIDCKHPGTTILIASLVNQSNQNVQERIQAMIMICTQAIKDRIDYTLQYEKYSLFGGDGTDLEKGSPQRNKKLNLLESMAQQLLLVKSIDTLLSREIWRHLLDKLVHFQIIYFFNEKLKADIGTVMKSSSVKVIDKPQTTKAIEQNYQIIEEFFENLADKSDIQKSLEHYNILKTYINTKIPEDLKIVLEQLIFSNEITTLENLEHALLWKYQQNDISEKNQNLIFKELTNTLEQHIGNQLKLMQLKQQDELEAFTKSREFRDPSFVGANLINLAKSDPVTSQDPIQIKQSSLQQQLSDEQVAIERSSFNLSLTLRCDAFNCQIWKKVNFTQKIFSKSNNIFSSKGGQFGNYKEYWATIQKNGLFLYFDQNMKGEIKAQYPTAAIKEILPEKMRNVEVKFMEGTVPGKKTAMESIKFKFKTPQIRNRFIQVLQHHVKFGNQNFQDLKQRKESYDQRCQFYRTKGLNTLQLDGDKLTERCQLDGNIQENLVHMIKMKVSFFNDQSGGSGLLVQSNAI